MSKQGESIKNCPFCGSSVSVERVPLEHYKGCVIFEIKCLNCGCERTLMQNDSVYRTEEEARANAIAQWNERTSPDDDKPVVRGEWIQVPANELEISHGYIFVNKCSKCGHRYIPENDNFCPNCGADMRETTNG